MISTIGRVLAEFWGYRNSDCYCRGLATESRVRTRGELSRLAQNVLLYAGAHKVLYQCLTTFCSCQNPTVEREYKANAHDRYDFVEL
jgi:hypothetical protein